jgi:UDPglucose 6-dehydrogenase
MTKATVGIIGNGFVGNAVYQNVRDKVETKIYDVDKNRSLNTFEEVLEQEYIFVCVPTPMKVDGSCDLSILEKLFEDISEKNEDPLGKERTFIIKSTVPIGTTKKLVEKYPLLWIVHNPEFLTARNAVSDLAEADRTVIGGDPLLTGRVAKLYWGYVYWNQEPEIIQTTSDESEAIKYFSNTFLAYKVAYFNKVYDVCEKLGMDYKNLRKGITTDPRIGESHTQVPGIDNDRGFGGTCFPKDLNSLINQMESHDINADMLTEVWKYNESIRKVIDWVVT